jgi:hypothetical protein
MNKIQVIIIIFILFSSSEIKKNIISTEIKKNQKMKIH